MKKLFEKLFVVSIYLFCIFILTELSFNYYSIKCLLPIKNANSYGYLTRKNLKTIIPLNKYSSRLQAQLALPFEAVKSNYYNNKKLNKGKRRSETIRWSRNTKRSTGRRRKIGMSFTICARSPDGIIGTRSGISPTRKNQKSFALRSRKSSAGLENARRLPVRKSSRTQTTRITSWFWSTFSAADGTFWRKTIGSRCSTPAQTMARTARRNSLRDGATCARWSATASSRPTRRRKPPSIRTMWKNATGGPSGTCRLEIIKIRRNLCSSKIFVWKAVCFAPSFGFVQGREGWESGFFCLFFTAPGWNFLKKEENKR